MSQNEEVNAQGESSDSRMPRVWSRIKGALISIYRAFADLKGVSVLGLLGTLIVAYFQYVSAYHDKVSAQSKDDLAAATATFTEATNAFSTAMTLQQTLFFNYRDAVSKNVDGDDKGLETRTAREILKGYDDARTDLRRNIDMLARKVENVYRLAE